MHSKPSFLWEKQSKLGEPSHAEDRQLIDAGTQECCPNETRACGTVQGDAMKNMVGLASTAGWDHSMDRTICMAFVT